MIRSMTGYGRSETTGRRFKIKVEIRSVNHRFCEVVPRLPRIAASLEDKVRKVVQDRVSRGRLDVFVEFQEVEGIPKQVKVDKNLALAYHNALKDLQRDVSLSGKINISLLASLPDVLGVAETEDDISVEWPYLEETLGKGLDELLAMRAREGEALARDIEKRALRVESLVSEIEKRAPLMVAEYRQRLESRLKDILPSGTLDETRLAMEIALYADRVNIDEEIVRIRSHLGQLMDAVRSEEAVGRKMDFLIQEINREVNTIGSKAADVQVAGLVVELKSELEKIREQIQNVE